MSSRWNRCRSQWILAAIFAVFAGNAIGLDGDPPARDDKSFGASLARVTADIKYLSSDELKGRLPGSPEMAVCEKYIIDEFKRIGLTSGVKDGSFMQKMELPGTRSVNRDATKMVLTGPMSSMELELDKDYKPQINRRDVSLDAELVFVGYGISASEYNYDEYKGVDVTDKIVVLIRMEPQQGNGDSVFEGTETSRYAFLQAKVSAAREAGAVGIIMVNDSVRAPDAEKDELSDYDMFGAATSRMPFVHMTRAKFDELLQSSPVVRGNGDKLDSLSAIEKTIDESLEPVSQRLGGWKAKIETAYGEQKIITSNLVGVIEGEGPNANETIVIGAHYDHLGLGAFGSNAPAGVQGVEVHNGADDNATGTAGIMELARRFAKRDKKPGRRLVFIAFTAEEMGLLGAAHYVREPLFPLESTACMLNYDMIGWLRDRKLTAFSWDSSPVFDGALERANEKMGEEKMNLLKPRGGFAGSDHLPFQGRGIPVMFLHTGLTNTYHTPEDDFETIDCEGATHVIDYTEHLIDELAALEEKPKFIDPNAAPRGVDLGATMSSVDNGVLIEIIDEDSIGAKAGLQAGDVILTVDDKSVSNRRSVNRALMSMRGSAAVFVVQRGEESVVINVEIPD